jgi:mannose-6-phosphate isomerase class I
MKKSKSSTISENHPRHFRPCLQALWGSGFILVACILVILALSEGIRQGLQIAALAAAGYSLWNGQRFWRMALTARRALWKAAWHELWRTQVPAQARLDYPNFDAFRRDRRAFLAFVKKQERRTRLGIQRRAWLAGLIWQNQLWLSDSAYTFLPERHRQTIHYLLQIRNPLHRWLAQIMGLHYLWEYLALMNFRVRPLPLPVSVAFQAFPWGKTFSELNLSGYLLELRQPFATEKKIAEAWIGAHPYNPSTIRIGHLPLSLHRLAGQLPEVITGRKDVGMGHLLKLLDAGAPTSWQMHYRDHPQYAKNESWTVLVDPERMRRLPEGTECARFYLGVRPIAEMRHPQLRELFAANPKKTRSELGSTIKTRMQDWLTNPDYAAWRTELLEALCNEFKLVVQAGELVAVCNGRWLASSSPGSGLLTVNIPGHTLHALYHTRHSIIFETQQSSDKTLRVHDYGRFDPERPLHIQEALTHADTEPRPGASFLGPAYDPGTPLCTLLETPHYWIRYGAVQAGSTLWLEHQAHYCLLWVRAGEGTLRVHGHPKPCRLTTGGALLLPAVCGPAEIKADTQVTFFAVQAARNKMAGGSHA